MKQFACRKFNEALCKFVEGLYNKLFACNYPSFVGNLLFLLYGMFAAFVNV